MPKVTFKPPLDQVGDAISSIDIGAALQKGIRKAAFLVEEKSKKEAPVDTGLLRSRIATDIGNLRAVVEPKTDYAGFVHEGTSPHFIGAPVRIRNVGWRYIGMHPGTKANPFMERGISRAKPRIDDIFKGELENQVNISIRAL